MKRTARMLIVTGVLMMALLLVLTITGAAVNAHDLIDSVDLSGLLERLIFWDHEFSPLSPIRTPFLWPPPPGF